MSGTQPVALYALKVPPGNIPVQAVPDFAAMFRVSMAAIDPTAEPEYDDVEDKKLPRSTLKIVRIPGHFFDEDDSEDGDDDDDEDDMLVELNGMDEGEDTSEEEENGGPSDPEKVQKAKTSHLAKAIAEQEDEDDGEDEDEDEEMSEDDAKAAAMLKKIMKRKGKGKGKGKATDDEEEEDEDLDDDDELGIEEIVVCTLDPEKNYQQPLDFVIGEDERIFFQVTGTHTVHLTGNYVIPTDDGQARLYDDEEEEDDYDLSPDEDELEAFEEEDVSSDELDDLADPRVTEVDIGEGEKEPPKLVASANGKGKNKRRAPASDDEEDNEEANLDDIMAKSLKAEEPAKAVKEEPKKLTKAEKKKLKKLKKNDGEAAPAATANSGSKTTEPKEAASTNGEKKVQFAKNLEQGPTPSATPPTKSDKKLEAKGTDGKATLGVKEVQGVIVDDRKLGTGPAAKKGNKVEMRYIGKLENGKVFDANKKGKPFGFKLGAGEVIKGWDIGVAGMSVGGERRITVPAHHGYGSKGSPPDIPPNSKLIFDLKLLTVT